MRKILITATLLLCSLNINAQSLMDLFGSSSSKAPAEPPKQRVEFVTSSIYGMWGYSKLTVALAENSPLKGFGGDAIVSQVTGMLNGIAKNSGITPNIFTATFNRSGSLILVVNGANSKAKYTVDPDTDSVLLDIRKVSDVEVGALSAKVIMYEDSATLLFDARELMIIADKIPTIAENGQYKMIKGVAGKVDGLLLGFEITKQ